MAVEYKIIFKLNDDGKTCIFRDKECVIQENENERYIIDDYLNYTLIEREEQIKAILDSSSEILNFSFCIFCIRVNFFGPTFDKEIDFSYSTFNKQTCFIRSKFQGKAKFYRSKFNENVTFEFSKFNSEADFNNSTFNKEAGFTDSTFQDKACFMSSIFNKKADFSNSTFNKEADFRATKIEFLNFSNVETGKDFTIDLKLSQIERFDYEDTDFKNAENSESYLKLKNFALKNNDQKNALNFYKKEMEKYKQEIEKKGKFSDKVILRFEKNISDYGTNPLKALAIMLIGSFIFNLIVTIVIIDSTKQDIINIISISTLLLNPTSSIEKLNIAKDVPLFLEALNFLKNIFFSILMYEVIKSFRKFSRKL